MMEQYQNFSKQLLHFIETKSPSLSFHHFSLHFGDDMLWFENLHTQFHLDYIVFVMYSSGDLTTKNKYEWESSDP